MKTIGEVIRDFKWLKDYERQERKHIQFTQEEEPKVGRYISASGGGDFTPAPSGTHVARCVRLLDLGTHHGEYQGKPNTQNQVYIGWELPNELESFGDEMKPYIVGRFFTNTLSEKGNLRQLLEAWRGRSFTTEELTKFDLQNILGKPCVLTIIHETKDGKTRAKVSSASQLMKGMECPPQINPSQVFWIDEWHQGVFDSLPEFFQNTIKDSDEYKARTQTKAPEKKNPDDIDDDIPF